MKALGQWLSFPLEAFDVSLNESTSPIFLECRDEDVRSWQISSIATDSGYASALTTPGTTGRVVSWDGTSALDDFIRRKRS